MSPNDQTIPVSTSPRTRAVQIAFLGLPWYKTYPAMMSHAEKLEEELALAERRLGILRKLCGYVENGSDTTVHIFQDDATKSWHVSVGASPFTTHTAYSESGFLSAIDAAAKLITEDQFHP